MKSGGRLYTVRIALEIYSHAYGYVMVELCEYANVIEQGIYSTGLKQKINVPRKAGAWSKSFSHISDSNRRWTIITNEKTINRVPVSDCECGSVPMMDATRLGPYKNSLNMDLPM